MREVYTYGAKLEIASPRFSQRADFITYICFICFVILVSWTLSLTVSDLHLLVLRVLSLRWFFKMTEHTHLLDAPPLATYTCINQHKTPTRLLEIELPLILICLVRISSARESHLTTFRA
jgi:hypothetical protein